MTTIRIGTRGSQLALWQAKTVAQRIADAAGTICQLLIIRTSGDERPSGPPDPPGSADVAVNVKATFVKEIEEALLDGRIDVAVHSSKDLSAVLPKGLTIGATLTREDPRDALLLPHAEPVADWDALCARMDRPMRIGTSSVRRAAQLRTIFSRAAFLPLRGNVETRLRKLDAGECDATVLACAGLKRLGLANRISLALPIGACIPAPGQGIVAVQIRENLRNIAEVVSRIGDRDAMDALVAERAIVRALGGGCQMPLGAHARIDGDDLEVDAIVTSAEGHRTVRETARGHRRDAVRIGESLANTLLQKGAAEILEL